MPRRDRDEMPVEIELHPVSVTYVDVVATRSVEPEAGDLVIEGSKALVSRPSPWPFAARATLLVALGCASWIACLGAGQVVKRIIA